MSEVGEVESLEVWKSGSPEDCENKCISDEF